MGDEPQQLSATRAMFQPWGSEDFLPAVDGAAGPADFWEPITSVSHSAIAAPSPPSPPNDFWDATPPLQQPEPIGLQAGIRAFDFWDPIPNLDAPAAEPVSDWSEAIALPLYEVGASENPFRLEEAPPSFEVIARRCARWLVSLLDLPTRKERLRFTGRFEELFEEFPHPNTFRVLSELAIDGASADDLLMAFQLKRIWTDNPIFWSIHRKAYRGPIIPDSGEKQLGWTRGIRLANLAKGLPAERVIDHDWYEDWLRLPYAGPLFWSFLEYATARLESFSKGVLAVPEIAASEDGMTFELTTRTISIDGMKLGSLARTGLLVRSGTDLLSSAFEKIPNPESRHYQAEAAE